MQESKIIPDDRKEHILFAAIFEKVLQKRLCSEDERSFLLSFFRKNEMLPILKKTEDCALNMKILFHIDTQLLKERLDFSLRNHHTSSGHRYWLSLSTNMSQINPQKSDSIFSV